MTDRDALELSPLHKPMDGLSRGTANACRLGLRDPVVKGGAHVLLVDDVSLFR